MNPYVHEFRHLLRSRTFIALLVAAVVVGAVPYVEVASTNVAITTMGFWFEAGNAFSFELWTLDPAGRPSDHVGVELSVIEFFGFNGSSPPKNVLDLTASSDSQGRITFVVPDRLVSNASYQASLIVHSGGSVEIFGVSLQNQSTGAPQSITNPLQAVADGFYSEHGRLVAVWAGPGGTPPTGYEAIGCDVPVPQGSFGPSNNCSAARGNFTLGPLSGYVTYLPPPPTLPAGNTTTYWTQVFEITNRTGSVAAVQTSSYGDCSIGACGPPLTPGPGLLNGFALDVALLLPLMALMVGYWAYANPRLTGTQDSVLTRPITRRGLFLVRYGTLVLTLLVATVLEVVLFDAELTSVLREPVPAGDVLGIVGGMTVAALALMGIVFLCAHLVRSTGAVLGIGIGVALATSIAWNLPVYLILRAFEPSNLSGQTMAVIDLRLELFAPPLYPNLAVGFLVGPPSFGGFDVYAAAAISGWLLILAGGAWITIPFLLAFWRSVTRD